MKLSLLTPSKKLVTEVEVSDLFAPGVEGEIEILPGYANESQEHLLGGGTVMAPIESSSVTTQIRGEVGIL